MGWIRRTTAGHYRGAYRDPDGKTVSKTFKLKGDAERWLRRHESRIDEGNYLDPRGAKKRMDVFWSEFLAGSDIRPSTRDRYERHWKLYIEPTFGNRSLGSVKPADVRAWRVEMQTAKKGAATIVAATRLLKTVFNRAVNDGLLARSPARTVENPSTDPQGGLRVLEAGEVARLAGAHPERFRALTYLLSYRGLRIGEAAALRVGDLDLMRGRLQISGTLTEVAGELYEGPPKTMAGARSVSLPPFLRDMLASHLAAFSNPKNAKAYVFTMPEGGPLRPNNYRKRVFYVAVRDAGLDSELSPHDLRDTAATLAFAEGATVKEVADMLGHANPSITLRRYTGVLESMKARTDERLDATFRKALGNEEANPAAFLRPFGRPAASASPRSGR